MPSLSKLWRVLDSLAVPATSHAQWRQLLGDDLSRVQPLLLLENRIAASVPDPGNPYGWFDVQRGKSDRYLGINAWTGEHLELSQQDVLVYRLCVKRIADAICEQLGLEDRFAALPGVPSTWRIASYVPLAGYDFPVFLSLNLQPLDSVPVLEGVATDTDGPFILFAPTRRKLSTHGEAMLRRRKACLLTLDESLEIDDAGRPVVTGAGRQRLAEFRRLHVPELARKQVADRFPTPAGARWSDVKIRFVDGETVSISVLGVHGRFIHKQLGLGYLKSNRPTNQWHLLRDFAANGGKITWQSKGASPRNRQRKRTLKDKLKKFFRIEGEPIEPLPDEKGWRTVFVVEQEK